MSEDSTVQMLDEGSEDHEEPTKTPLQEWLQDQVPHAARRALAVLLHYHDVGSEAIAASIGCSGQDVQAWVACYRDGGISALELWGAAPTESPTVDEAVPNADGEPDDPQAAEAEAIEEALIGETQVSTVPVDTDPQIPDADSLGGEESVEETAGVHMPKRDHGLWQDKEPIETQDPVEHEISGSISGDKDWRIVAASRRGRKHAHEGLFREDTFAIGFESGWHLVVVADGAGSASLSRVGARLAADVCLERLVSSARLLPEDSEDTDELENGLRDSIKDAWLAVVDEAGDRDIDTRELATTLLILAHKPIDEGHLVVSAQVGDGLLAVWNRDESVDILEEPDQGQFAGETLFLTGISPRAGLVGRVHSRYLSSDIQFLLAMTDGVSDDFFPVEQQLARLVDPLGNLVGTELSEAESCLMELLRYEKRGSFDDRTLAVIAAPQLGEPHRERDEHESNTDER